MGEGEDAGVGALAGGAEARVVSVLGDQDGRARGEGEDAVPLPAAADGFERRVPVGEHLAAFAEGQAVVGAYDEAAADVLRRDGAFGGAVVEVLLVAGLAKEGDGLGGVVDEFAADVAGEESESASVAFFDAQGEGVVERVGLGLAEVGEVAIESFGGGDGGVEEAGVAGEGALFAQEVEGTVAMGEGGVGTIAGGRGAVGGGVADLCIDGGGTVGVNRCTFR